MKKMMIHLIATALLIGFAATVYARPIIHEFAQ